MPWRQATAVAVFVAMCACGSSSTAQHPSPSPSQSPTPSPVASASPTGPCAANVPTGLPRLMAVLERKSPPGDPSLSRPLASHDTLALAGLNAVARAHATFQPRSRPYIGNAETLLSPHEAYVLHGLSYYIDGIGSVWTMGADGRQATVARFPIGLSQQEVSFAVSPDGCHLAATVLTIPPKGAPTSGEPFPTLNGTWKLEVMVADVGGTAQTIRSWTSVQYPGQSGGLQNLVLVGWDATGPIVVTDSPLGTQNGDAIDNFDFFSGAVTHLGPDGTPGTAVAMPAGCIPMQVTPDGRITCASQGANGSSVQIAIVNMAGVVEAGPFTAAGNPDVAVAAGGVVAATGHWCKGSATWTLR